MLAYACGDLPGSFIYESRFGPSYRESHAVTLIALVGTVVLVLLVRRHLQALNASIEAIELNTIAPGAVDQTGASSPSTLGKDPLQGLGTAISTLAAHRRQCVVERFRRC